MNRWLLVLAFVTAAANAESPSDFAYGIPLVPDGSGPFARVSLPAAVYEGTSGPGLSDLRVFNAEGAVVPFALVAPASSTREKKPPVSLPMFPLRVAHGVRDVAGLSLSVNQTASGTSINLSTKDGQPVSGERLIGYVLDTSEIEEPLMALSFALPETAQPPTMRLSIEASDDLASWRTVIGNAPLVNLEYAGRRLTRDRIEFAPVKAKYLRVVWRASEPLIDFTAVSGERGDRAIDAARQWREITGTAVAGKEGDYEYDLGGAFPIDRIGVDLAEINSVVPAQLFARSTSKDEWRPVLTTVFYRLGEAGGEVSSPPVTVAGGDHRYWLVRADTRAGGAGREAPRLRVGWQAPELVFAARGGAPFMLAYGKHNATAGALPVATLIPGYDAAKGLPASVGVAQPSASMQLGGPSRLRAPLDTKRWMLWAILVLGAAILGWMAYRLSRQIGTPSVAAAKTGSDDAASPPRPD
jgi:hypothetical protein